MVAMVDGATGVGEAREAREVEERAASIEAEVDEIAGFLNAQHARLVDCAAALLDDRRMWAGAGVWSMRQWLAWRAGVGDAVANRVVTVAERIDELPTCIAAFRAGELSLDQMASIAAGAPAWSDAQICTLARSMTVRQIRRMVSSYPTDDDRDERDPSVDTDTDTYTDTDTDTDTDAEEPGAGRGDGDADKSEGRRGRTHDDEYCSMRWDDQGRLRLHAVASADLGLLIEAAMREARDRLFQDGDQDVTWLDALGELANRSLDGVTEAGRRRRFTISLFLDTDAAMTDASRWRLPDAIRSHLSCDGVLTPTYCEDGLPVSVGRAQYVVPERTRRIVERRDHGQCRVPGCTARHFLEIHHIVHWLEGGRTDTENLLTLCPHHHRLHHRGRLGISGDADEPNGVVFTDRAGRPIRPSGARPIPPAGPPPPPTGVYQHPTGERLDPRWLALCAPPPATTSAA